MIGRKNGITIIDKAVGQFRNIIIQLDNGLTLVKEKSVENANEIDSLTAENIFLEQKTTQATTFRDNLKEMLGEKSPAIEPKNKEGK